MFGKQNKMEIIRNSVVKTVDLSLHKDIIPQCIVDNSDVINEVLNTGDPGLCAETIVSVQELKENVSEIFEKEDLSNVKSFLNFLINEEIDNLMF